MSCLYLSEVEARLLSEVEASVINEQLSITTVH
jgi:hypothetical protein